PQKYSESVNQHYGRSDLGKTILDGLRAEGKDIDNLSYEDLSPVDQFHSGGRGATLGLARLAKLSRGLRVLDVGGGLGGPARTLAFEFGCNVTVLDLTEEYCRAGEMLTSRTGLGNLVSFKNGSALNIPFPDESFDVVWT
ncbi:MAG: methyltransferase domain-containing protein, partial [Nitrososphaerota archaeon]|nr:methyltransferase domain-containing protein [Nitrososphaerota archaeon]